MLVPKHTPFHGDKRCRQQRFPLYFSRDLHQKIVYVYIPRTGQVMLKMKSKHVASTITEKKKKREMLLLKVCRDVPAWPGRGAATLLWIADRGRGSCRIRVQESKRI